MTAPTINREEWLARAVGTLRLWFAEHGATIPDVQVSCGFPSKGGRSTKKRTIGECWPAAAAGDAKPHILVSPTIADPVDVLGILIHEVVHAAVGCEHGHRKPFGRLATAMGLLGPMRSTTIGPELRARLGPLIESLGPYPHGALSAAGRKKDGIRQLKATCPACGNILRLSKKASEGPGGMPWCSCAGEEAMNRYRLEGADEDENEGEEEG
jgi:hypothetical protein